MAKITNPRDHFAIRKLPRSTEYKLTMDGCRVASGTREHCEAHMAWRIDAELYPSAAK